MMFLSASAAKNKCSASMLLHVPTAEDRYGSGIASTKTTHPKAAKLV
jgi:hypothetical protein